MKNIDFRFVVAILFMAGSLWYGVRAFAIYQDNLWCATLAGDPPRCDDIGDAICASPGSAGTDKCGYCSGGAKTLKKMCVKWEGRRCFAPGLVEEPGACSGGEMYEGPCSFSGGCEAKPLGKYCPDTSEMDCEPLR